jgi:hypothetical protein
MKKSLILLIATALACQAFTLQSKEITVIEKRQPVDTESDESITVVIGDDLLRFDSSDSLVLIKMGNRSLNIQESPEGRKLDIEKYEKEQPEEIISERKWDQDRDDDERYRGGRHFRGHWAGVEIGFNNYIYASSMTLPDEIDYMTLDASNSNFFNINFSQINIGFSRYAGLVSGIGLNCNSYRFDNSNSITTGEDGNITPYFPDGAGPIKKSKFKTIYLNIPLMLEFQIPAGYSNRLNIAAGVIGGLKLKAWTKLVYEDGEKIRSKGDYNLNLFRGGLTARIGYQNFMIYGSYYLTQWFQDQRGPNGFNLEPFEIGLAFTFND